MPFPNAFEHQRFHVRTPAGERTTRSFRELLTERAFAHPGLPDGHPLGPDEAFALDYPQEYFNVAALGLLAFLAQAAFEPTDAKALARHLAAPLFDADFERGVGPLRESFLVDGPGPRFMQGRMPDVASAKKDIRLLERMVLSAPPAANHLGSKEFLNRPTPRLAVAPDQAALLAFARGTFYEGTGGSGFQKGVNGDTPVRTLLTEAADGDSVRLRRSVWLNVLSAEAQREPAGRYAADDVSGAYRGWFWELPPARDVPIGGITLASALGWMSANHWLLFDDDADDGTCAVTGLPVSGRSAAQVVKSSTGIGYGQKSTKDDDGGGENASRLFHHPHVPLQRLRDKKTGDFAGYRPFDASRLRGLTDAIGASFFTAPGDGGHVEAAPVVRQLAESRPLRKAVAAPRLVVFGFHMLSGQKNVRGGFETDTFRFDLPDADDAATAERMEVAAGLLHEAATYAERVAGALGRAVQKAAGAGTRVVEDADPAKAHLPRLSVLKEDRFEPRKTSDGRGFSGDAVGRLWRAVQRGEPGRAVPYADGLHSLVADLAGSPGDGDALLAQKDRVLTGWEASVRAWATAAFNDAVEGHRTARRTLALVALAESEFRRSLACASFDPPDWCRPRGAKGARPAADTSDPTPDPPQLALPF